MKFKQWGCLKYNQACGVRFYQILRVEPFLARFHAQQAFDILLVAVNTTHHFQGDLLSTETHKPQETIYLKHSQNKLLPTVSKLFTVNFLLDYFITILRHHSQWCQSCKNDTTTLRTWIYWKSHATLVSRNSISVEITSYKLRRAWKWDMPSFPESINTILSLLSSIEKSWVVSNLVSMVIEWAVTCWKPHLLAVNMHKQRRNSNREVFPAW